MPDMHGSEYMIFVGTYTENRKSEGIYYYRMDSATGYLKFAGKTVGVVNPSFIAIDRSRRYLYAVNEVGQFAGKSGGAVSSFSIDEKSGELTLLNQQPTIGSGPCYVSVHNTGRFAFVANYGSGSVAVFPIHDDGSLDGASDFVQHEGSSIDPRRQEGPHAHCIIPDPQGRYLFVPDLGLDKTIIYRLKADQGKLEPNEPHWAKTELGAGPRHITFHPSGQFAYLINEIGNTIVAYAYDADHGSLRELQVVPTLPDGFGGVSHCADIHVHPSGAFVYGSNRGHDSIVIFRIDQQSGKLTYVDHEPTQGRNPRNFAIDPTGSYLLAANQDTDTIVTFRIDPDDGRLNATGDIATTFTPVCIVVSQWTGQ